MTKEELKEQFSIHCTKLNRKGKLVVAGTPMDIINWVADKFCQPDVSGQLPPDENELWKEANRIYNTKNNTQDGRDLQMKNFKITRR